MLHDDDVVIGEEFLFPRHIDIEVRVGLVEIVDSHAVDTSRRLDQTAVDPRLSDRGMGKENQDSTCQLSVTALLNHIRLPSIPDLLVWPLRFDMRPAVVMLLIGAVAASAHASETAVWGAEKTGYRFDRE
jgi:hypothetical protein